MWIAILSVFMAYALIPNMATKERGRLMINIENVRESKGDIHVALYKDPSCFLDDRGIIHGQVIKVTATGSLWAMIEELDYGLYALAAYLDLNNNGKLDKNMLGIPTEPYAFAKKEPSKWRNPAFQEVAFQMNSPEKNLRITLEVWKHR